MTIATPEELADVVRNSARVHALGGGTKSALGADQGAMVADMRRMSGIVEYDPGEFTITALAGTSLKEIEAALDVHGQSLPFDPPLAEDGATIGGTIAAGLSGPGRYRFGGVRDFILQTRFVSGKGEVVRAGAKVVKNAAGFDLPKMLVGSLGRLGILTEATFKVFPHPKEYATVEARFPDFAAAVHALMRLSRSPFDLEALELSPPGIIWIRLGGDSSTFDDRTKHLRTFLASGPTETLVMLGEEEKAFWSGRRKRCGGGAHGPHLSRTQSRDALSGAAAAANAVTGAGSDQGQTRIPSAPLGTGGAMRSTKIPLSPKAILSLDPLLEKNGAERIYMAGGQTAWVWWPGDVAALGALLTQLSLSGLVVQGPTPAAGASPLLGARKGREFMQRVKRALDPENKFGPID